MQRKLLSAFTAFILCSAASSYCQDSFGSNIRFTPGARIGYNKGLGLQASVTASNFAPEFPFKIRLGAGLTFLNPGDALDARRIFINNNTNGTPEKKGRSIDIRLDFLVTRTVFGLDNSYVSAGPRFSTFKGNFKYVGGNEDFDVKSHQWGIGAGIENHFKMTPAMDLILAYGLDFYIPSTLTGHDTSYSPDNDNVNPRTDNQNNNVYFIYKDANKAIRQPVFMPYIMLGMNF
jgi:hypothetical protein